MVYVGSEAYHPLPLKKTILLGERLNHTAAKRPFNWLKCGVSIAGKGSGSGPRAGTRELVQCYWSCLLAEKVLELNNVDRQSR